MSMKKWIYFFIILFSTTLASCSSPTVNSAVGSSDTNVQPALSTDGEDIPATLVPLLFEDPIEKLKFVEIDFWYAWNRYGVDPYQRLVDQYNQSNDYDIQVSARNLQEYGEISQEMFSAIAINDLPNVALGYNYQYLEWDQFGEILIDLTPYVNDAVLGMDAAIRSDFYSVFWEHDIYNDKRLGFPAQRSGQIILYNQTWAQELGFSTPPATVEDFKTQACAAAESNGDGTGGWFINTSTASLTSWLNAFNAQIDPVSGGYQFNSPEAAAAFEFLYELMDLGCAWDPGTQYPNDQFAARQGLFYTSSIAGLSIQFEVIEKAKIEDVWLPISFPGVSGDPVITIYGPSYVVTRSTPEEQAASWLFIKYLLEPANQAILMEESEGFPLSKAAADQMIASGLDSAQWLAAVDLLENARYEPRYQSWSAVRAALRDAAKILYTYNFDPESIPNLLEQLQLTAEELHAETGGN